MMSGPGALWLGSWWSASCEIVGVILSIIMCWFGGGPAGIALSHGKASSVLLFFLEIGVRFRGVLLLR
jgi:hypothetical protein